MGGKDFGITGLQQGLIDEAPVSVDWSPIFFRAAWNWEGVRRPGRRGSFQELDEGRGILGWSHDLWWNVVQREILQSCGNDQHPPNVKIA